jgi:hypothetical protein
MIGWVMSKELERMYKEAALAKFQILSRHLSEGTEENYKES